MSEIIRFFGNSTPLELTQIYGSPLYVYNEQILRRQCQKLKGSFQYPMVKFHFSMKSNSNINLLRIIKSEGIYVDAMSPGELFIAQTSGFKHDEIIYVCNNVSSDEMLLADKQNILITVDSVSQLQQLISLKIQRCGLRFNTGIGAGHSQKVITGGKLTKFGITIEQLPNVIKIVESSDIQIEGIHQHIGSGSLHKDDFIQGAKQIMNVAQKFIQYGLAFVDFGGGFGIQYHKIELQQPMQFELTELAEELDQMFYNFSKEAMKDIEFKFEPGRILIAECAVLLGKVHAIKANGPTKYIGTDIGFNNLMRPILYSAYHDIKVYQHNLAPGEEKVTVVGNICETGDIIASDRVLPIISEKDIISVQDVGAYGMAMASNYNCRLRPAEILINIDDSIKVIRRADTFQDIIRNYVQTDLKFESIAQEFNIAKLDIESKPKKRLWLGGSLIQVKFIAALSIIFGIIYSLVRTQLF